MYHFFESIDNTRGDALIGYFVKAVDTVTDDTVSIYADSNSTPIISVSGVADMAQVDSDGDASFWIVEGEYHLDIYATDATTFVKRVPDLPMNSGPAGPTGAQGPAGDVAKALTRTDLAGIVGATAGMTRYLAEAGREGAFVFDSANHSADVTADPQQGIYAAPSSDTTGASGAWVRQVPTKILTPYMFGAGGGYTDVESAKAGTDDHAALQAMFGFWKLYPVYSVSLLGLYWATTVTITISQVPNPLTYQTTPSAIYGGSIVAKTGSTGTDLVVLNYPYGLINGTLGAYGYIASTTYANRGWVNGISLTDSKGLRFTAGIDGGGFKRWLVYTNLDTLTTPGDGAGNNIGIVCPRIKGIACGSASKEITAAGLTYTFDTVTLSGATNSTTQISLVHFTTALSTDLKVDDKFIFVNPTTSKREAYEVTAIDLVGNTLTFAMWLPVAGTVAGTMYSAHGGILHLEGGNTGFTTWGQVTGMYSGIVYEDLGLYGCQVSEVGSEFSSINHAIGHSGGSPVYGAEVLHWHSESTYIDEFIGGATTNRGAWIGPASMRGAGTQGADGDWLGMAYKQSPRAGTTTAPSSNLGGQRHMDGVSFFDENGTLLQDEAPTSTEGIGTSGPSTTFTVDNRPHVRHWRQWLRGTQTPTINVDWHENYSELKKGKHWIQVELWGTGARGEVGGAITVQLVAARVTDGFTLNGGTAAITIARLRGPAVIRIVRDMQSHDLRMNVVEQPSSGLIPPTFTNGDAAATLDPSTSAKIQIWNSPLTANRAVTLNTTNAADGDIFEIIRTAASTGAFTLNVGTGPLIAMPAGTWCRVVYDGTAAAWRLDAYGPLAKAATSSATYVAATGGTTTDTQCRASQVQLAADLADMKAKLQAAGLMT